MKYRGGYKYQLAEEEVFKTRVLSGTIIDTVRIRLDAAGVLTVREGYSFDGPSGPIIDRKTNMSASCLHDALYQLMRMELLPHYYWRQADAEYGRQLKKCKAWDITIKVNLAGLELMKGKHALPENRKKVYEAP